MLQGCRLFLRCQNLLAGHCVAGSRLFKRRSAGFSSGVVTYQPCIVFLQCQNIPAGHCVAGCRPFKPRSAGCLSVSEPTCRSLCCKGAGCLSGVRTYLQGTVLQGCRLFMRCGNLSA